MYLLNCILLQQAITKMIKTGFNPILKPYPFSLGVKILLTLETILI